jgi:hypothetical protein
VRRCDIPLRQRLCYRCEKQENEGEAEFDCHGHGRGYRAIAHIVRCNVPGVNFRSPPLFGIYA